MPPLPSRPPTTRRRRPPRAPLPRGVVRRARKCPRARRGDGWGRAPIGTTSTESPAPRSPCSAVTSSPRGPATSARSASSTTTARRRTRCATRSGAAGVRRNFGHSPVSLSVSRDVRALSATPLGTRRGGAWSVSFEVAAARAGADVAGGAISAPAASTPRGPGRGRRRRRSRPRAAVRHFGVHRRVHGRRQALGALVLLGTWLFGAQVFPAASVIASAGALTRYRTRPGGVGVWRTSLLGLVWLLNWSTLGGVDEARGGRSTTAGYRIVLLMRPSAAWIALFALVRGR